jgi:hypothetical protein
LRSPFASVPASTNGVSQPHTSAFYTKHDRIAGSGYAGRDFHRTSLTCPQIKRRSPRARNPAPAQSTEASQPRHAKCCANRSAASEKSMAWQRLIASNALTHDSPKHAARVGPRSEQLGKDASGEEATRSVAVRSANTVPAVAHLVIMHARIVDGGCEIEHDGRQPTYGVQDRI